VNVQVACPRGSNLSFGDVRGILGGGHACGREYALIDPAKLSAGCATFRTPASGARSISWRAERERDDGGERGVSLTGTRPLRCGVAGAPGTKNRRRRVHRFLREREREISLYAESSALETPSVSAAPAAAVTYKSRDKKSFKVCNKVRLQPAADFSRWTPKQVAAIIS